MKVRYVRLLFIAVALCCVVLPAMQAKAAVDIAGWDHSMVLVNCPIHTGVLATRTVTAFGDNTHYQFGNPALGAGPGVVLNGATTNPLYGVIAVAAGERHTIFLRSNGTVWIAGTQLPGHSGSGEAVNYMASPVPWLTNVVAIAAGRYHSMALTSAGLLYTWGLNTNGELGLGNTTHTPYPKLVAGTYRAIAGGWEHSAAVGTDGKLYLWGKNASGQLGDGTVAQSLSPKVLSSSSNVIDVALGKGFTIYVQGDGTVYGMGRNDKGQLGLGDFTNRLTPVAIDGLERADNPDARVFDVAAGENHALALYDDGIIYSWGDNAWGQLGNGAFAEVKNIPVKVNNINSGGQIDAGANHSMVVTNAGCDTAGGVYMWGLNNKRQVVPTGTPAEFYVNPTTIGLTTCSQLPTLYLSNNSCVETTDPEQQIEVAVNMVDAVNPVKFLKFDIVFPDTCLTWTGMNTASPSLLQNWTKSWVRTGNRIRTIFTIGADASKTLAAGTSGKLFGIKFNVNDCRCDCADVYLDSLPDQASPDSDDTLLFGIYGTADDVTAADNWCQDWGKVTRVPIIEEFTANDMSVAEIEQGDPVTLQWSVDPNDTVPTVFLVPNPDDGVVVFVEELWSLYGGVGTKDDNPVYDTVYGLIINNSCGGAASESVTVDVTNVGPQPPVAVITEPAAATSTVDRATTSIVYLDGCASYTVPAGGTLSYLWQKVSGPAVTIQNTGTPCRAYFVPPTTTGTLVFSLTVTDTSTALTDVETRTIIITDSGSGGGNTAPVADAGPETVTVLEGQTVVLSGVNSYDPDGDTLTYLWEQISGPAITIAAPTNATTSFVAPAVGSSGAEIVIRLTVRDTSNAADTDSLLVGVVPEGSETNNPPVAVIAGAETQVAVPGQTFTLNGAGSYDPDGDTITYKWVQISGPTVTINGSTSATASFLVPNVTGSAEIVIQLQVRDTSSALGTDGILIGVVSETPTENDPPVANAGPDQVVTTGQVVILDGTGSYDPDGDTLTYQWGLTSGPAVALSSDTSASPTFTAPSVGSSGATLVFTLQVGDGKGGAASDTVQIFVESAGPPVANAGPDQVVMEGQTVILNGSNSYDPKGGPLTFAWTLLNQGISIDPEDDTGIVTWFQAPSVPAGTGPDGIVLNIKLTVADQYLETATDQVNITVLPAASLSPVTVGGIYKNVPMGSGDTVSWNAYLQTYTDGSLLVILTQDLVKFYVFTDSDWTDGVTMKADDTGSGLNLTLEYNGDGSMSAGLVNGGDPIAFTLYKWFESIDSDSPLDGIHKELFKINLFAQTYKAYQSAIFIYTVDYSKFYVFVDPDWTDGTSLTNDEGNHGWDMNLVEDGGEATHIATLTLDSGIPNAYNLVKVMDAPAYQAE